MFELGQEKDAYLKRYKANVMALIKSMEIMSVAFIDQYGEPLVSKDEKK